MKDILTIAEKAYYEWVRVRGQSNVPDWNHLADNVRDAWIAAITVACAEVV